MQRFLLLLILFPILSIGQTYDFNSASPSTVWEGVQSTETYNANSLRLDYNSTQSPKFRASNAGVDASTNKILAITIINKSSEIQLLKIKHDKKETTGNRFVAFELSAAPTDGDTFYLDLSNSEWDNNGSAGVVQDNIEIILRGTGDAALTLDGFIEVDKIEFVDVVPRRSFTFDSAGDLEGFNPRNDATGTVAGGLLEVTIGGSSGASQIRQETFSVDATQNKYMHIRFQNNSPNNQLRLAFANTGGGRTFVNGSMTPNSTDFEIVTIDLTSNSAWNAETIISDYDIRFRNQNNGNSSDAGTIDIDFILFNNSSNIEYTYANAKWSPANPVDIASFSDDVVIKDNVSITGNITCEDLTIFANGNLDLNGNQLNSKGAITNNGVFQNTTGTLRVSSNSLQTITGNPITVNNLYIINAGGVNLDADVDVVGTLTLDEGVVTTQTTTPGILTLKSSNGQSAVIDEVNTGSISGDVTIEQFYPANRAFRFVSSPVNMTGTIYDNWQEGGTTISGFGTQITGGSSVNGFDASTSNNPSAFTFDNSYTDPNNSWVALSSTNIGLNAGDPLRILVRGDRTLDLTSTTTANDVTLRTTGSIVTGDVTATLNSSAPGNFALVGNPYQAQVDLGTTLSETVSEDVNPNFYWMWQPSSNNYVAYSFVAGGVQSGVTEFIQPGQSFFVETTTSPASADNTAGFAPEVVFQEAQKSSATGTTATYSTNNIDIVSIDLIKNSAIKDNVRMFYMENGNNAIDNMDATKLWGQGEQLSINSNNEWFSIETRNYPIQDERVQLNIHNFADGAYSFSIDLPQLANTSVRLEDNFLNTATPLSTGMNSVDFMIDASQAGGDDPNRFVLVYSDTTLGVEDGDAFAKAINLYPNPANSGTVYLDGLQAGETAGVEIFNMLGQMLGQSHIDQVSNSQQAISLPELARGQYLVKVTQLGKAQTIKLQIQ